MSADAPATGECCGNCGCWRPRKPIPEGVDLTKLGIDPAAGRCLRDPKPVGKHAEEWCASHRRKVPADG